MNEYSLMKLRSRFIDFKPQLRYYVPKDLYDLVDYAVLFKNGWNIEFFSFSPEYKEIWSKLRVSEDYGYCKLLELGYDDIYGCYSVDVVCADLLRYLYSMHDYYTSPISESRWKSRALDIGWSEGEVNVGWIEYKAKCDRAFELRHGRHIHMDITPILSKISR